ncbi:MAG: c-type cytochrome [Candidatus Binatia bacterium]
MKWSSPLLLAFLVLFLLTDSVEAWPWNRDMYDQPSVVPQEHPLPPPPGAIPVSGRERLLTWKEALKLQNPIPASSHSQEKGRRLFMLYCALCHGAEGKGDGPVAEKLSASTDLSSILGERTDGALYYQILNGGEVMPTYKASITPGERWDVINYLRQLPAE